jgi:hypothetical protein
MSSIEDLQASLARLRDEAKVQAHLGSMEAREEWEALETKWNHFAAQARLHESAEGIGSAVEAVGRELLSAYQRLAKAL